MRYSYLAVLVISIQASSASVSTRRYVCKTPTIAPNCYWTRGRLEFANGTPALRLWKLGTTRILGIYSGPGTYPGDLNGDNEHPELPANVQTQLKAFDTQVYADFEVCPLEPEKPQTMQAACIESARNISVKDFDK